MTWIWVILAAAAIGGIVSYMSSGKKEDAVAGAAGAGIGCAYIVFQIFLAIVSISILFAIGKWLFS